MQTDAFFFQLAFQLKYKLVYHPSDNLRSELLEGNNAVQAVAEFRRKGLLDGFHVITGMILMRKTNGGAVDAIGTGVGGHHQYDIAEIRLAAVVVGQGAVIHYLQ